MIWVMHTEERSILFRGKRLHHANSGTVGRNPNQSNGSKLLQEIETALNEEHPRHTCLISAHAIISLPVGLYEMLLQPPSQTNRSGGAAVADATNRRPSIDRTERLSPLRVHVHRVVKIRRRYGDPNRLPNPEVNEVYLRDASLNVAVYEGAAPQRILRPRAALLSTLERDLNYRVPFPRGVRGQDRRRDA